MEKLLNSLEYIFPTLTVRHVTTVLEQEHLIRTLGQAGNHPGKGETPKLIEISVDREDRTSYARQNLRKCPMSVGGRSPHVDPSPHNPFGTLSMPLAKSRDLIGIGKLNASRFDSGKGAILHKRLSRFRNQRCNSLGHARGGGYRNGTTDTVTEEDRSVYAK